MQKFWSKTLIGFLMLSIFLAPVGVGIQKAEAQLLPGQDTIQPPLTNLDQTDTDGDGIPDVTDTDDDNDGILDNTPPGAPTNGSSEYLDCGLRHMGGCIANIFYVIWEITAWVARGAGEFLDFFIDYSILSSSYRNDFIEKGWGAIRDVANIFFIVALIYVGLKTILGMNVSDNKRLVGMIILIALVINFSLFTTKIVIDASNVLAKIFYNNISPVNANGVPISPDSTENKSITVGMVGHFNPHTILGTAQDHAQAGGKSIGEFIFITLMAIVITGYMIYIFVSIALLFVARVVSLWIAMIFSPIAFASLTIGADMGGLGFKKWWSELLKVAFMAPLFIFFLYIIVLFLDVLGTGTTNFKSDNATIQNLMGVFIPFAILMVLLMKAKKLAVEYSGDMGAAITKAGQVVGGLAVGAATGGAAMLGSGVVGGGAAKLMSKYGEKWKSSGYTTNEDGSITANKGMGAYLSRQMLKTTDATTKATFDVRKTKAGAKLGAVSGMDFQSSSLIGLGSKDGGYKGAGERHAEELKKESELFKTTMNDKQVAAWSEAEQYKYDAKKNAAMEKQGANFDEAEFIKKNGYKPKNYTTAEQLNNARMIAFRDSLGQRDLIGSLAYSLSPKLVDKTNFENSLEYKDWEKLKAKRMEEAHKKQGDAFNEKLFNDTYEEVYKNKTGLRGVLSAGMLGNSKKPTVESINKGRVETAKMVIGGGAAVITGGLTGSLIGATGVGRVVGGSAALGQGWIQDSGEGKMAASIDKQLAGLGKVEARITEVKDVLANYQEKISKVETNTNTNIANIVTVKKDASGNPLRDAKGNPIKLRGDDGKIILENVKIDEDALTLAISKNTANEVSYKSKIEALNREGVLSTDQRMIDAVENLEKNITEASMLKSIEGIGEKIATNQSKLYELGGKKAEVGK